MPSIPHVNPDPSFSPAALPKDRFCRLLFAVSIIVFIGTCIVGIILVLLRIEKPLVTAPLVMVMLGLLREMRRIELWFSSPDEQRILASKQDHEPLLLAIRGIVQCLANVREKARSRRSRSKGSPPANGGKADPKTSPTTK
jgi:hypothetical protein